MLYYTGRDVREQLYCSDDELSRKRVLKFSRAITNYVAARTAENEDRQILYKPLKMQLGKR